MTDMLTAAPAAAERHRPARRRLVVVLATMAAAALAWAVIELGGGYVLRAPSMGDASGMDIGLGAVLASSGVAGLAAWGSLAALDRWSPRPRLIWTVLATVVFLISLGAPLSGEGIGTPNRAALVALHAVVAMGLIPGLAATARGAR